MKLSFLKTIVVCTLGAFGILGVSYAAPTLICPSPQVVTQYWKTATAGKNVTFVDSSTNFSSSWEIVGSDLNANKPATATGFTGVQIRTKAIGSGIPNDVDCGYLTDSSNPTIKIVHVINNPASPKPFYQGIGSGWDSVPAKSNCSGSDVGSCTFTTAPASN